MPDKHQLSQRMDQDQALHVDGGLTLSQRIAIKWLLQDYYCDMATLAETIDAIDAVRQFGTAQPDLFD